MTDSKKPIPFDEPSVWDYVIEKIKFWETTPPDTHGDMGEAESVQKINFPWFTLAAAILAVIAQLSFEPSANRFAWFGILLYAGALGCVCIAIFKGEWNLPEIKPNTSSVMKTDFKIELLLIGFGFGIVAYVLFGSGQFGLFNIAFLVLSVVFLFLAFWEPREKVQFNFRGTLSKFVQRGLQIRITWRTLLILAAIAVILFFNFHRLESVPPEMVSDQAEKLLDIHDILNGYTPVYFPRNTGREVLHFYLTALYMRLFNLDISFFNLKVVAVFANLLTLFFIYLLGKELGNKWVGLWAAFFAGIAYWPLLFTRLALRIPYYPLFVAPVMYFLVRGLRRQKINDILWAGLFLGLGLHGYTPFRIVPIFVVLAVLIYILHKPAENRRLQAVFALVLMAFISLILFIPLLRFWLANPDLFAYRAFSRLTSMEAGFQGSPVIIFLKNFWKASVMFFWNNGTIWAHSVPNRPALEVVSGALYFLGIVSLIARYIRRRHWVDLVVLVSIPMMLMPSILSLAYPGENPSLNRTAGAVVPVFIVIGMAFETLVRSFWERVRGKGGRIILIVGVLFVLIWSGANNYDLVFNQYYQIYRASSWNTSEIGRVAEMFIESVGSPQTTYVVGYPHWVDSRLVAINSGYAGLDYAIFPDQIPQTAQNPQAKMFFLSVLDTENQQLLQRTFPAGVLTQYDSTVENKDFMIFFVPPDQGETP
jgi:hypothetical protein